MIPRSGSPSPLKTECTWVSVLYHCQPVPPPAPDAEPPPTTAATAKPAAMAAAAAVTAPAVVTLAIRRRPPRTIPPEGGAPRVGTTRRDGARVGSPSGWLSLRLTPAPSGSMLGSRHPCHHGTRGAAPKRCSHGPR